MIQCDYTRSVRTGGEKNDTAQNKEGFYLIFGKKIGETIYSLNLLPFGGFVKLHGETTEDTITDTSRAFLNKNKRVRTLIILAGVMMNFVLAIVAFSLVYSFTGIPKETQNVKIVEVSANSPAASSGLEVNDIVREIDGNKIASNQELIQTVDSMKGREITLMVERNTELVEIKALPRENPPEGEGALGVLISTSEIYYPPFWQRPFIGIYYGFKESLFWVGVVVGGFIKLFRDLFGGVIPRDIAGPVGIFALTSEAAKFGILPLINFIGILSVNLAILNVIPFPALDGGRLLFVGIESFFGKRIVPRVEAAIHTVGMIILILLILAITASDIKKLILGGGISGYIDSVLK
ncbi:MAG: Membrane-associated zinc metalloprotease [Candidatus Woesebacteria bacterium GW2011_GWA1_39_21b]|uniref:Membrane-associated zinc metalloprotease n=1 Tax=Candidatus Woesebacteria bacterium GW2011_GWA1_39_21b TaxID=1618551 RepID=A0A0G0NLV3_9BACT|nr:MAG: Membrane-associated zinc metalloprotease [Candidatus Woesebacteria bacterium GW2011_GWA1_39_21b]